MIIPKFENKKDLIEFLVRNKAELASQKKSQLKFTDPISISHKRDEHVDVLVHKIITSTEGDDLVKGIIKRTIVANAYNWMDSHSDVHIPGIFSEAIASGDKIFHLHDHLFQIMAKVGQPQRFYEQQIPLASLGLNQIGSTMCLLMDSNIMKDYNPMIYLEYLNKQIYQHSVGMYYQQLFLCVNDTDYKEDFAYWNMYFPQVINKDDVMEQGYFWAVTKAGLRETSCVLAGSNELTPVLPVTESAAQKEENKNIIEPEKQGLDYKGLFNLLKTS